MTKEERPGSALLPGEHVSVRTRFDGTWADGYQVCREQDGRYLVQRCSDGFELPADFDVEELRPS